MIQASIITFLDPDHRVLNQCRGRFGIWFWADLFLVSYILVNEEWQKQFQELRVAEKVGWVSASSWGIYHLRCFDSRHSSSAWSHESCHLSDAAHMWALDFQRSPTSILISGSLLMASTLISKKRSVRRRDSLPKRWRKGWAFSDRIAGIGRAVSSSEMEDISLQVCANTSTVFVTLPPSPFEPLLNTQTTTTKWQEVPSQSFCHTSITSLCCQAAP